MLLSIIQYIKGYVQIRVTGYSAERFLNACSYRGIYLWGLHPVNGAYEMYISVSGFRKLKPIIKKTGTKVAVVRRFGLPFFLHRYRKRKIFFAGAMLCIAAVYIMSLFIWDIDISGNMTRTDETLLSFLSGRDVQHGMKKSKVDCARIVKDIRKEYDNIIWVSASIQGTKLIIQVKENEDSIQAVEQTEEAASEEPLDIVADRDCVISKIITRKGVPMVKEGDRVKKGDLLVCGRVPVNNDAGETIAYQYHPSEAEILGTTTINYEEEQAVTYIEKMDTGVEKEEIFLKIGDYRLGTGSASHDYGHYEVYSREKQWRIGDSFYLPVVTGKRVIRPYIPKEHTYGEKEIQQMLTGKFDLYCKELQKKGVEIIENNVKIYTEPENAVARGTLTVVMPIGQTVPTDVVEVPLNNEENEMSGDNIDGNNGNSD